LAFVIPVVEKLLRDSEALSVQQNRVGALIISPTRELARQIFDNVQLFTAGSCLSSVLLVGGTDVKADIAKCAAGCNIIVGTPGRILDIIRKHAGSLVWNKLEMLGAYLCVSAAISVVHSYLQLCAKVYALSTLGVAVLDEADTLLDMGFRDTLTQILAALPKQRRTGLFSATQTTEVRALARAGLRNPAVVVVKVQKDAAAASDSHEATSQHAPAPSAHGWVTPAGLKNFYTVCKHASEKFDQLCTFLRDIHTRGEKAIVFFLTCASVDYYSKIFSSPAFRSAIGLPDIDALPLLALHGQMAAKKRTGNFESFAAAPTGALFCTDVAARGIDLPDVDWIIQV
jgi:ATP-dependent RNA helicase DDX55/SPB4